jgi:hypothetical protein
MALTLPVFVCVTLTLLVAAAADAPIVSFRTKLFTMDLFSDCTAQSTYISGASSSRVPFVSLYNRVADAHAMNLEPCVSLRAGKRGIVSVGAAHDYGEVDIAIKEHDTYLLFNVSSLRAWHADPVERHLAFGEFWQGLLSNDTAPVVMGKLQGAHALPASAGPSAGFMTITANGYYKYIFNAIEGDKLAFSFTGNASSDVAKTWQTVGMDQGVLQNNPQRFLSWLWTDFTEATASQVIERAKILGVDTVVILNDWHEVGEELTVSRTNFPKGINHTVELLRAEGIQTGLHMHPDIVWPCSNSTGIECLTTGNGISPFVLDCPTCLMPEALAPTFRSGMPQPHYHTPPYTEDIGFWWGHSVKPHTGPSAEIHHQFSTAQQEGAHTASTPNGNPHPCSQGSCNAHDWPENDWAPDMLLYGEVHRSTRGAYRGGGAIGLDGKSAYGVVDFSDHLSQQEAEDVSPRGDDWLAKVGLGSECTIGMIVHPADIARPGTQQGGRGHGAAATQVLVAMEGVFSLSLDAERRLLWQVNTTHGPLVAHGRTAITDPNSTGVIVKATFNGTSGVAKVFISSRLDGSSSPSPLLSLPSFPSGRSEDEGRAQPHQLAMYPPHGATPSGGVANSLKMSVGAGVTAGLVHSYFQGALEEIYLKNCSTENRMAYMYSDDNRIQGTFLIDLSSAKGREFFATSIVNVLKQANFSALQYDGFEKLQLIGATDFGHSLKTFASGLYRGTPTPDWYHYEGWPLRVGQGVLQGVAQTNEKMLEEQIGGGHGYRPAVECSFMAPGLGPWRTDMAPYVDERGNDYVREGLEWHPKLLIRMELTGTVINAYNTGLDDSRKPNSTFEADYWFGGLITGGIAPQPEGGSLAAQTAVEQRVGEWVRLYRKYGHSVEGGVKTLVYDSKCCHIQGDCEWVACKDVVVTRLEGGTQRGLSPAAAVRGLYVASQAAISVPPELTPNATTLLVFHAFNASTVQLHHGLATHTHLTIVLTSPIDRKRLVLSGPFWDLAKQDVLLTLRARNGTVLERKSCFGGPQTGQRQWDSGDLQADAGASLVLQKSG